MQSSFDLYVKELSKDRYNPLLYEQERSLLNQYASGSQVAFEKLVDSHLRFVMYYILRNYKVPRSVDLMDVIQDGNGGLMEGIKRFNLTQTCRVFSYCFYWIRYRINCFTLGEHQKDVRIFNSNVDWSLLEDTGSSLAEEETSEELQIQAVEDIIQYISDILSPRERTVVSLFYGLQPPYIPKTLQEIGSILHINFERVRQIRENALSKLQKNTIQGFLP